jgi:hypothetical protein
VHIVESYFGVIENHQLIRVWGVQRNVTEKRKAAVERDKLQQQLHQAMKMESLGRLAVVLPMISTTSSPPSAAITPWRMMETREASPVMDYLSEIEKSTSTRRG